MFLAETLVDWVTQITLSITNEELGASEAVMLAVDGLRLYEIPEIGEHVRLVAEAELSESTLIVEILVETTATEPSTKRLVATGRFVFALSRLGNPLRSNPLPMLEVDFQIMQSRLRAQLLLDTLPEPAKTFRLVLA